MGALFSKKKKKKKKKKRKKREDKRKEPLPLKKNTKEQETVDS